MTLWSKISKLFGRSHDYLNDDDDLMSVLIPPGTTEDPVAWDEHWEQLIAHGFGAKLEDLFCEDRALILGMRDNGLNTVLCAGNGISQEPKALALAGFDVTVLDLSPAAIRIFQETEFDQAYQEQFLDENMKRPGGSVTYEVGDIMDPTVCPGPYDVIIERRTAQLFHGEKMDAALAALADRLVEHGMFFTHCHDNRWRPGEKREPRTEQWFRDQGWSIWNGQLTEGTTQSRRLAWTFLTTG